MRYDAAHRLRDAGTVGIIPTDTVYGLVARAHDPIAVHRLYRIKQRQGKPGTIIAADIEQLVTLGIKKRYLMSVAQYWPAPLSVVFPVDMSLEYLHEGINSVAVRIPTPVKLRELLMETGPLLTSSANPAGLPVSETIDEARAYFGDAVDFYIDNGRLDGRNPSTVIKVIDDAIEIIRQGAFTLPE